MLYIVVTNDEGKGTASANISSKLPYKMRMEARYLPCSVLHAYHPLDNTKNQFLSRRHAFKKWNLFNQ